MRRGSGTFFATFPATSSILLVCLSLHALAGYYTQKGPPRKDLLQSLLDIDGRILLNLGMNSLEGVRHGELWRLLSCAFLHGGLIHIGMNMLFLSDIGRLCEPMLGTERFTVAYVASGVGGSLGSIAYALATGGPAYSIGASGALMGLVGLLLGFSLRHRDRDLRDQILHMVIYIVILTLFIGRVDHAAHAGGFITGACFGYFTPRYVSSQGARAFRIPFILSVLAVGASLALALWNFFGR
jgi:membrane associated rhomboid family serine protease